MTPKERIQDLCQRYGVSRPFGQRLLPLASRADEVRPEMRRRMIAFLERSFAAQAKLEAEEGPARAKRASRRHPEGDILQTVAGILHPWQPPRWLDRWAEKTQGPDPS